MQFHSATPGYISGLRFYKAAANTGTHIGSLWTADGTLLAQATFSNESDSGWQQVAFSSPVAIAAGTTYVAGYHTDTGHYSADEGYFSTSDYTNSPLTAPGGDPVQPQRPLRLQPHPHLPHRHLQRQQLLGRRRLHPDSAYRCRSRCRPLRPRSRRVHPSP